jgi:DNA polymerase-1
MLLQVHDELVLEVSDGDADALVALVSEEMERAAELKVPLVVEAGRGRSWADAH